TPLLPHSPPFPYTTLFRSALRPRERGTGHGGGESASLERAGGVGSFFLHTQLAKAVLRGDPRHREQRRAALAQGDRRLPVGERQPLPVAPHGPTPLRESRSRFGRRCRSVADEVRLAAGAHAGQSVRATGGSATGAFERPREGRHVGCPCRGAACCAPTSRPL